MSENGVVTAEAPPALQPRLQVEASRIVEIVREENPTAYELAIRRATIEAQAKLIEDLLATRSGDTVP